MLGPLALSAAMNPVYLLLIACGGALCVVIGALED